MAWRSRLLMVGFLLLVGRPRQVRAQAATDTLPPEVTPSAVASGKDLFAGEGLCMACHGADAKGALGPDLTDRVWLHGKGTFGEIVARILEGVSSEQSKLGQIMPPRGGSGLTDQQVRLVAAYVWSLSHRPGQK